jgi:hypothetical protein
MKTNSFKHELHHLRHMNIEKTFALAAAILAPCLATFAQQPQAPAPSAAPPASASATVTVPVVPPPATSPSSGPGDTLANPSEASVVAHGTAPEPSAEPASLTNEPGVDDIAPLITFDGAPLTDAVNALALQANLNIQFDPKLLNTIGPDGRPVPISPPLITAKWKNVTAKQALQALLDNWGWQLITNPLNPIGRITAKDPAALEPLTTTVVQLEYSTPSNILAEVQPTLSTRSSIISDPRTHKLIILDRGQAGANQQEHQLGQGS